MSPAGRLAPPTAPWPPPIAEAPRPVFVRAFESPRGYAGTSHRHRLAQVVYPLRGVVTVETDCGTWVVTRLTAVAIPPWTEHRVAAHGNASVRNLFVDPDVHPDLVEQVETVHVSELLHELIREAGRHYTDFDDDDDVVPAVIELIVRLLPTMAVSRTSVWLPRVEHPLLRPIAEALDEDPADDTTIDGWAARIGLSSRHLSRLFKEDTGVTLSTWRALHHVNHALVQLAGGHNVTRVATDLGYRSTSSFIEMFKRHTGHTPGAWTPARPGDA